MIMQLVKDNFEERVDDIESYFELVNKIELVIGRGNSLFDIDGNLYKIKPNQQKMMFSSIYLHLYNLIESTVVLLIETVERYAKEGIDGQLKHLSSKMRTLYVKSVAGTPDQVNYDKRIEKALDLFEQALNIKPFDIKIPVGGGGNWDVKAISSISSSIGIKIRLPRSLNERVNRPFRDDKKPIRLIKEIRNSLAHGSLSFSRCGENHVASDFRQLIDIVKEYLNHIINEYEKFIIKDKGYKV